MEAQIIFNIIIIILLIITIIMILISKKKNIEPNIDVMLKLASEQQRDSVQRQLSAAATEQFERFGKIQESVQQTLMTSREETNRQLREFEEQIDKRLSVIQKSSVESNEKISTSITSTLQTSRVETNKQLREFEEQIDKRLSEIQKSSMESNEKIRTNVTSMLQASRVETNERLGDFSTKLDTRLSAIGQQTQTTLKTGREESNKQISEFRQQLDARLLSIQKQSTENNEKVNATLENKMKNLQESNEKRLEQMQGVVDEKLQKTLETRLTQSFETVGKHLESVQQGLGEMKSLAEDAKSLKNALTNVKDRGTYGEVRLERLLEDILAPSQYEKNAHITDGKIVEFAIKLPGNDDTPLLLPIDAKFPIEDYNRLMAAEEKVEIEASRKSLLQSIRRFAIDISAKYISPPKTTNFALMFLPTEGLYAEVIRDAAFFEELREKYKIIVMGATTLSGFLGSLQIGFKTLAIEKHSQEVWETLGKVKGEFKKFEGALSTAHKQIKTAEGTLEKLSGTRMRAIDRALRGVEEIGVLEQEEDQFSLEMIEIDQED